MYESEINKDSQQLHQTITKLTILLKPPTKLSETRDAISLLETNLIPQVRQFWSVLDSLPNELGMSFLTKTFKRAQVLWMDLCSLLAGFIQTEDGRKEIETLAKSGVTKRHYLVSTGIVWNEANGFTSGEVIENNLCAVVKVLEEVKGMYEDAVTEFGEIVKEFVEGGEDEGDNESMDDDDDEYFDDEFESEEEEEVLGPKHTKDEIESIGEKLDQASLLPTLPPSDTLDIAKRLQSVLKTIQFLLTKSIKTLSDSRVICLYNKTNSGMITALDKIANSVERLTEDVDDVVLLFHGARKLSGKKATKVLALLKGVAECCDNWVQQVCVILKDAENGDQDSEWFMKCAKVVVKGIEDIEKQIHA